MKRQLFFVLLLSFLTPIVVSGQDLYSSLYEFAYSLFSPDPNEGQTVFLTALIPMGGMAEGMGNAYTALAEDASFLEYNPAGSAILEKSELALFHNNWILDTRIEGIVYSSRFYDLGLSLGGKWLYLPFTERDDIGQAVSGGYYSEVLLVSNLAYQFFKGYYFDGISLGVNAKLAYRSVPDYTDDEGNIIAGSGAGQSALAFLFDVGVLTRFNLFKFYSSRDKNFSLGLALKNLGAPVMGEPLPTVATVGIAYRFLRPFIISADLSQPINFQDLSISEKFYWSLGYRMIITDFWSLSAGLQVKAANPRITVGAELAFRPLVLTINYTLDLTTQFTPLNRMSIQAKFDLGDMGRADSQKSADEIYLLGLEAYASGDLQEAIELWKMVLELNPYFDPAREGIDTASRTLELQEQIYDLQKLQ